MLQLTQKWTRRRKIKMENELYHYGVMGMKWGVRRYQNEDGSLTAAGRRRYLTDSGKAAVERLGIRTGGSSSSDSKDQSFYRKHEKAIKVGLAVAGTALAAYGGYKLASSSTVRRFAAKGIKRLKGADILSPADLKKMGIKTFDVKTFDVNKVDIPTVSGLNAADLLKENNGFKEFDLDKLPKFKKTISAEELINGVNPKYTDNWLSNKFAGSNMNCFNTTLAYEMRKRGYDVSASLNETGALPEQIGRYFKGLKSESINSFKYSQSNFVDLWDAQWDGKLKERGLQVQKAISSDILKSYPDGARGNAYIPMGAANHFISWEIKDNNVVFSNPQNPKINLVEQVFGVFDQTGPGGQRYGTYVIRLDDLELNPSELFSDMIDSTDQYVRNVLHNKKIVPGQHDTLTLKGENFVMKYA